MPEWRDVRGYEGFYLVNELGQIKSADRVVKSGNKLIHRNGKMLRQQLRGKVKKYKSVPLCINGNCEHKSVHRIVAEAFLPNPDCLPEVNHKDKDTFNNKVDNLEWCSRQYNIEYSKNKPVKQISGDSTIAIFKSIVDASKKTGICRTAINNVVTGWAITAGGFRWEYCD